MATFTSHHIQIFNYHVSAVSITAEYLFFKNGVQSKTQAISTDILSVTRIKLPNKSVTATPPFSSDSNIVSNHPNRIVSDPGCPPWKPPGFEWSYRGAFGENSGFHTPDILPARPALHKDSGFPVCCRRQTGKDLQTV